MQKIYELAKQAQENGKRLLITDYLGSDGSKSTFKARFLPGHLGYLGMVSAAKKEVQLGKVRKPAHIPADVFTKAAEQQIRSWDTIMMKPTTSFDDQAPIILQGTKLTLRHIEIEMVSVAAAKKPVKHRDSNTEASAYIREESAMRNYKGMVVLEPGKFTSVEITH